MYKVIGYLDGRKVINWRMEHIPRLGDIMRFDSKKGDIYGKVTDVCWCMNEESAQGQRVNIVMESDSESKEITK